MNDDMKFEEVSALKCLSSPPHPEASAIKTSRCGFVLTRSRNHENQHNFTSEAFSFKFVQRVFMLHENIFPIQSTTHLMVFSQHERVLWSEASPADEFGTLVRHQTIKMEMFLGLRLQN